jgi:lipid II:glycine glycyltransferase (peptidoglycan interpeptide bridge formation enzyme)
MVTIDRKLGGLVPYRTVFFPTRAALADSLAAAQVARYFWTEVDLDHNPLLVRHERTATICIDLQHPLDKILAAMSQTTRRKLRAAEKIGDRFAIVRNGPDGPRDLLALYNQLALSKRYGVQPIDLSVVERYAAHSDILLAYLDDAPLCAHLNLRDAEIGRTRLVFSASRRFDDPETARLCGIINCELHWHEILTYREEGFATYDFGGISDGENAGIDQFKHGFGGAVVSEHTYLCAGTPALARLLLKLRALIKRPPQLEVQHAA